ncbi:hypothetical protein J6590_102651, partial [Homalodisca vitripennis]
MKKHESNSPIGLVRILKQVSRHQPYLIIKMQPADFKNFTETSKLLNYKEVPFASVSRLRFTRTLYTIFIKSSHDPLEPENCKYIKFSEPPQRKCKKQTLSASKQPSSSSSEVNVLAVKPKIQKQCIDISEAKKKDIKAAFQFMPLQD